MVNRISSGVPGLDELIEGGFPEGSSILVSGGPGTGKSILCMEYLYNGAKNGEPGVYVTLEEGPHNLWWNMQRFKWDLLSLERANKLKIYKFEPSVDLQEDLEAQTKRIVEKAKQMGAKRLVIDSISAFAFWINDVAKIRYAIYVLVEELRKINCTTLLACEIAGERHKFSSFGVEEFLVDGILLLHFVPPQHYFSVRKMRGTNHDTNVHPMYINENGLQVDPKQVVPWKEIEGY